MNSIETITSAAPPTSDQKSVGAEPKAIPRTRKEGRAEPAANDRRTKKADPARKAENLLKEVLRRNPSLRNRLRIDVDNQARRFVYFSVNRETGEVVKQYPTEEELRRLVPGQDAGGISVDKRV